MTSPAAPRVQSGPHPMKGPHWTVGVHRRMRSLSFANSFAFSVVHIWGRGTPAWIWVTLVLVFLVYPQLAWLRARNAIDSQRAELQNIVLDCLLVAIPVAAMGFPLWITFTLFVATTINNSIASGVRGILPGIGAYALGSLIGSAAVGFVYSPEHSGWVTGLCIFGLIWYLLGIGHVSWQRTNKLRATREELKESQRALVAANDALHLRIDEIHALQAELREQANRDALTGLYNRRYLQETMDRELARCLREQTPLCVILIDIDHFKGVNDRHGHAAGDDVLRQLGRLLMGEARQEDVPCRHGGDEFMLLMPTMPLVAARERAELWRAQFAAMAVRAGEDQVHATLSIGIAEFPTHARSAEALIQCADVALYLAKAGGRDRVVSYQPRSGQTTSENSKI
jgi:diguanylate cyclase